MANDPISYDRSDLRGILKAFKAMDDQAAEEAKRQSGALAEYAKSSIIDAAANRQFGQAVALRIALGTKVSKSSKIGELNIGFAAQKFSGGATTKDLWGGSEFGSNKYKQFPVWSGKFGRGSKGWFIYPTLRQIQPYLVSQWEISFTKILKEWT
jgi:hypothetical protein